MNEHDLQLPSLELAFLQHFFKYGQEKNSCIPLNESSESDQSRQESLWGKSVHEASYQLPKNCHILQRCNNCVELYQQNQTDLGCLAGNVKK